MLSRSVCTLGPMLRRLLPIITIALLAACCRADGPANADFEAPLDGDKIPGWFVPPVAAQNGWTATIDTKGENGSRCIVLQRSTDSAPREGFGNIMQSFSAAPYRGKRVTISLLAAAGKRDGGAGRIQPWVRVDRKDDLRGFFDNCADLPVLSRSLIPVTFTADIEPDAEFINVGLMVIGGDGPAYLDSVSVVAKEIPVVRIDPPNPLSPTEKSALLALAHTLGYVRHYHPSDQAASTDWHVFSVEAVRSIADVKTATDVRDRLQSIFAPIAPTLQVSTEPLGEFDPKSMMTDGDQPTRTFAWRHHGFAPPPPTGVGAHAANLNIYKSTRVATPTSASMPSDLPKLGEHVTRDYPIVAVDGTSMALHVRVPIVLYADIKGTLPVPKVTYVPGIEPVDLSANDRSTRLAAVILAWNVLQHHYPYFHVVNVDWDKALEVALEEAAVSPDLASFGRTLDAMLAKLRDGHGSVWSKSGNPTGGVLPLHIQVLPVPTPPHGDPAPVPVVLQSYTGQGQQHAVERGDVIVSIDGRSAQALYDDAALHECAANDANLRFRAADAMLRRATHEPVKLVVQSATDYPLGPSREITLTPVAHGKVPPLAAASAPVTREIEPGYWYVDLDRVTDAQLEAIKDDLARAKGLIFDLRGYPDTFSMGFLGHLSRRDLQCAHWHVPIANWPDRKNLKFDHARWSLPALEPRFNAPPRNVAFVTDGRAISAAETFMGIVEAYKLGEIVGEETAGTNGNVNTIVMPGGYSAMFTGMKVLKHDGTEHHRVGIRPTVPCVPTIEGIAAARDELLEKALETVKRDQ